MKAGLEIHQQLSTGKLFCACPAELSEEVLLTVSRRLRATGGENHAIDPAAMFQASRGLTYRYEATPTSCLVELDEEPPRALNPEAVDVALTMAVLLHARPLDEIEVMRKIVVDGSNPAGFQRTALVAVDGEIEVDGAKVSIASICLEEDAARKIGEAPGEVTYRLDRQGIPLIEIATGPDIVDGAQARSVAEAIGQLLRSTGRVRRGIGTIREDLNVSAPGGTRVEIKGVQELAKIRRYAEGEVERQTWLAHVADELRRREASVPGTAPVDLTELLRSGARGPIGRALEQGGVVLGLKLPGFAGLLGNPSGGEARLGRELADHARSVGLGGLLHSDELPAQGVEGTLEGAVRTSLGAAGAGDAFVLVAAADPALVRLGLEAIRRRAETAVHGVPPETRDPLPDGRTRYSRPLPGRDRMYPETDVPPVPVGTERLARVHAGLPERPEAVRARLAGLGLSADLAGQLQRSGDAPLFLELVRRGRAPAAVARLLSQEVPAVAAEPETIAGWDASTQLLDDLLLAVEDGRFSKEGVLPVLRELARGAGDLAEAQKRAGLSGLAPEELGRLAGEVVRRNAALIGARGESAFQPLMGDLMREVRGRADGQRVAEALRTALAARRPPERA